MPTLRVLHRFSALVVGLFLALHLANHFVGLFGQQRHIDFMQVARVLYRYPVVEALLMVLLVWQACSGLVLLARRWKARDGVIAWLQIVSGAYLLVFLINHVGAVLYGRFALGLDTDIRFAAAGFHVGSLGIFFAPYYALAIFALFTHVGCAVYWKIGWASPLLRKSVLGVFMLVGATAGLLVVLALMGILYEVDIPDAYKATYEDLAG